MADEERIVRELVKLIESLRYILLKIHREVAMTIPLMESQRESEYAIHQIDDVLDQVVHKKEFMGVTNSQSESRDLNHN